jgi:hypothetical protein
MWVKPAPGLVVRDPRTKSLVPSDGIEVPDTDLTFARLVRDGDLVVFTPVAAKPATAAPPAPPAPPAQATSKEGEA